jgi:hypothetical protein
MMEATRTSETLDDNYFTRQYIPEDNSELQVWCVLSEVRTEFLNNIQTSFFFKGLILD